MIEHKKIDHILKEAFEKCPNIVDGRCQQELTCHECAVARILALIASEQQPRYSVKNPKIITICGSSRFCQIMAVCRWLIEKDEGAITLGLHLLPDWYMTRTADHLAEAEGVADKLNELHLRKIDMSDEIFVVDYQGYIGKDTQREIEYATAKGMPIRYYSKEELGLLVDGMIDAALKGGK